MKISALSVYVATAILLASSCAPIDDPPPDADHPELADVQPAPAACPDSIVANPIVDRGFWPYNNGPLRWYFLGGGAWGPAWVCEYTNPYATVTVEADAPSDTPTCIWDGSRGFQCAAVESCSPTSNTCTVSNSRYIECPELGAGTPNSFDKDGQSVRWPNQTHKATPVDLIFSFETARLSGGVAGQIPESRKGGRLICEYTTSVSGGYVTFVVP